MQKQIILDHEAMAETDEEAETFWHVVWFECPERCGYDAAHPMGLIAHVQNGEHWSEDW